MSKVMTSHEWIEFQAMCEKNNWPIPPTCGEGCDGSCMEETLKARASQNKQGE